MNNPGIPTWDAEEPDWQGEEPLFDGTYNDPYEERVGEPVPSKRSVASSSIVADPKNAPADLPPVRITQLPTGFYVIAGVLSGLLLVCIAQLSAILVEVYR